MNVNELLNLSKCIVIKIGSALITDSKNGTLKSEWLESLAKDIKTLTPKNDKNVIIVSSGAISLGRKSLNLNFTTPSNKLEIQQKQAAASIGQITLIHAFQTAFGRQDIDISQVLLNPSDTESRRTHLNARATLTTLLENNFIPIINENDTTATDEIRFGDNDKLAARVAQMIGADMLLILSTTDGLYTDNPQMNKAAQHIPHVDDINDDILNIAQEATSGISSGGMKSKVQSAQIAVNAGTNVVITSGEPHAPITKLLDGAQKSTLFTAKDTPGNARKRWIAANLDPKGSVLIDDGAVKALRAGKSLLPAGIKKVSGTFERGDVIEIKDNRETVLGLGLVNYNAIETALIKGHHSDEFDTLLGYRGRDVLIHRNDLVLK